jgi:hypothetical protein
MCSIIRPLPLLKQSSLHWQVACYH